jgi:lactate permease
MNLLIQALPLLTLVMLLASGRANALQACAAALLMSLPAVWLALPGPGAMPGFLGQAASQGLWLAVAPIGIITGGLVFHAAVGGGAGSATPGQSVPDTLFTAAFLLGPFTESVTGFGVGCVFALGMIRSVGVTGAAAAAIALVSQSLIPWGGLGPGTSVGAALAGVSAQAMASRNAVQLAAVLLLMAPLFWRWCELAGHRVLWPIRLGQLGWIAALGALLVGLHHVAPWELCGFLATGPVLAVRLLLARRPRDASDWGRALRGAFPYLLLATVLLSSRLWQHPPAWQPFADLPGLALNHAMLALWAVALVLLMARRHPAGTMRSALMRARRPAMALLLFVLLARLLGNAGVPQALAASLAGSIGSAAPFAGPLLAGIAGFFAGTNVGSNAAMMPLQSALGRLAGLDPVVLPAIQNGTPFLLLSPQLTAIASGLAGGGATPRGIWAIAWPVFAIALLVGMVSVAIG